VTNPPEQQDDRKKALLALAAAAAALLARSWADLADAQTKLLAALTRSMRRRRTGAVSAAVRTALRDFAAATARFDEAASALVSRWASIDLPVAYRAGAEDALHTAVLSADQARKSFTWTAAHQSTLTALAAGYYTTLMQRVAEGVRRAQAFQRAVAEAARQEAADPAALTAAHHLGTVVYADDSRHPAAAWAASALTAQAAAIANAAAVRAAVDDLDAQWMEIADGPECGWTAHNDPDHADGTLRSVEEAGAWPISHPGCIRRPIPRPDLNGLPGIEEGQVLT
jgi:hypothetical protein